MDDLSICKRIAEIEGKEFYLLESGDEIYPLIKVWHDSVLKDNCVPKKYFEAHDYNPLTDDALCFKFAVDEQMMLSWTECPAGSGKAYFVVVDGNTTNYCDTPNRAVCMAKLKEFIDD